MASDDRRGTRRCLRSLATGAGEDEDHDVLDEAERALAGVRLSVRFLDAGGDRRLRAAVASAVREGERERVVRGRAALRSLAAFRRATAGEEQPTPRAAGSDTPTGDSRGEG